MLTKEIYEKYRQEAVKYLNKAHIVITKDEMDRIEVAEYDLNDPENIGLELVVYVNTERCCAKELVLLPGQACPEHRHPPIHGTEGKEETFRCRYGTVYLYVEGDETIPLSGQVPEKYKDVLTVRHEIVLHAGDQYTIAPNTLHWFRAGENGAVVSKFSTKSMDEFDIYTDKRIDPAGRRSI